ncbi:MAG TPA: LmbE-like protein [Desulfitobacterium dehalogenans]|uniref:LmbE-like protein n=1 Tax=Desulfitobacterium dehalogenans TaxID=36854 RepID=A0A7C6Z618_9FIRM|nr:LmbE-like protein [Desulfitobacterium dehalogenans]
MESGKRMLLLGAYSMEVVECGGALCKNADAGGISHAAILFASAKMQEDLKKSAAILGTSVEFLNMDAGKISASYEEKLALIKIIRTFQPDIIITQDPEHCVSDLDPGRRPFMTLVLEAIALAGRAYALDELPGLKPARSATLYYMTPEHPNCVVDILPVWEKKCAAMDALEAQLHYFGEKEEETPEQLRQRKMAVPNWEDIESPLERGMLWKREMDKAFYMYPASTGHCRALYAEPYRRDGHFVLDNLLI